MIECGWCGATAPADADRCPSCHHAHPARPWVQRGEEPPQVGDAGRPSLDEPEIRRRYAAARAKLEAGGQPATVESLAELLDRSPRTVREWRQRYALR